jgi:serine/threonine-protein kinase
VWAFGVVLYEMLTGRGPFQGESVSDTLAAVLKTDPDWSALPGDTPASIRRLLRRCIQRDRKRRLRDIGDALVEIDEAQTEPEASTAPSAVKPSRRWPWAVAGALAIALALAVALLYQATRPVARPLMRLDVELGPGVVLAGSSPQGGLAISPDGTRVVFRVRGADGKIRLATRLLDRNEVVTLAGTEDAASPFFSPNGQWIAFATPGKLKKIAAEGGAPVTLCEFSSIFLGGSWGDDGNIIGALGLARGLSRIPSAGGAPAPVTNLSQEKREFRHSWPQVLPGSQAVLFTAHFGGLEEANIEILSLKTGERKTLQRGSFFGRYVANPNGAGHLVYLQQNTLFAAPFDLSRLVLAGDPQPVVQDINNSRDAGADFAFSQTGTVVYLSGRGDSQQSIFWLDSAGKTQPLHAPPGIYSFPRFSPDGTRLAFAMDDGQGNRDIWVQNLERDTGLRVTTMPGPNLSPVWTPDGRNIFYLSDNPAAPGIYSVRADGAGEARRLTDGKIRLYPSSFSPDGKRLALFGPSHAGNLEIHMLTAPIEGSPDEKRLGEAEPILRSPFITIFPVFSPDGHWLAYQSNQSGTREVYVKPFPGQGGGQQISSGGGWFPVWSGKGRELFFRDADSRIMVVDYTASGDSFVSGKPRVWSEHRLLELVSPPAPTYDLAPNGKRFAVILYPDGTADQKPVTHLTFLLNFFDELRRRAPAAGN